LAVLCLGGRTAHAQAGPMAYWLPNWPIGFGGNPAAGQSSNTYGNFPGFDGSDARGGGFSYTRTNFPNGLFIGSGSSGIGSGMGGINQIGAFGNISSLSSEGVQFGYNFQNAPLTVYGGFNTLKYTTGIGGPFAPFDTTSGTLPVYSAHAGFELRPTSNLSLCHSGSATPSRRATSIRSCCPALLRLSAVAANAAREKWPFGPAALSELSPLCAPKRTFTDHSEFIGSHPGPGPERIRRSCRISGKRQVRSIRARRFRRARAL
jgi:hypothetical protein